MTENRFESICGKWRNAILSKKNREVLTFLLFLLFAVFLWFLNNRERTFEADITLPVTYIELPQNVSTGNTLPSSFKVTVRDKGQNIYSYVFHPKDYTFSIDLMKWKNKSGIAHIQLQKLKDEVSEVLRPTTEVLRILPDTLTIYYIDGKCKDVPVKLSSDIKPSKQFMLVGDPVLNPSKISVFAPEELLKQVDYVETELLSVEDFHDSAVINVAIKPIEGAKFSQNSVDVTIAAESFTETSVSVPITGVNVPKGYRLRVFPSSVNVSFLVRSSQYGKISANDFKVQIDYREVSKKPDEALQKISIARSPSYAVQPLLSQDKVECLIEKHSPK